MIGKLPTLSSSRALVSSLFLYYDATKFTHKFIKSDDYEIDDSPNINSPQKHNDKEVIISYN